MLDALREEVFEANLELVRRGLVLYTFGNASGRDPHSGLVAIKPSGVPYDAMKPSDLVIVDLDGRVVEGSLRPSSDLATHLVLYRAFAGVGGVVHTHSRYATAWAQACREIPCLGTTHADYVHGPVPVTEDMDPADVAAAYEERTGDAIVRRFAHLDPLAVPAVLVAHHGPFCWGRDAAGAAHMAVVLEELAALASITVELNPAIACAPQCLVDKHFFRKHGAGAYYGQPGKA